MKCYIEGLLLDNEPIPPKKSLEEYLNNPDFSDGVLAIVEVDFSKVCGKTTRVNISLPEVFLKQIDRYTRLHGGNRSGFLVEATMSYMAKHNSSKKQGQTSK